MKKLTLKEMTENEQREVKTELDRARKNQDRPLSNAEQNRIKDEAIKRIMASREQRAKAERAKRKAEKVQPTSNTFNWAASISTRPSR